MESAHREAPTLAGQQLLITGAAGGLGTALVIGALNRGAAVWATDRSQADLERLRERVGPGKDRLSLLAADLGRAEVAIGLCQDILARGVALSGLINNAAVLVAKPIPETTVEDFDLQVSVNLRSPYFLAREVIERNLEAGRRCNVVNIVSGAARTGGVFNSVAYAATKAGLLALTKGFARTYGPRGVRVNAVAPTAMSAPMAAALSPDEKAQFTEQVPLRRFSDPSEVAAAALWLLSEDPSVVTCATLDVSGGWTMI